MSTDLDLRSRSLHYGRSYCPGTHGTAAYMTASEIARDPELSAPDGSFLGVCPFPGSVRGAKLYANRPENILTIAGPGAGKTSSHAITNLLSHYETVRINLSGNTRDSYNPLDSIRTREKGGREQWAEEDASDLAGDMSKDNPQSEFWTSSARMFLVLYLLHVATGRLDDTVNGPRPVARNMQEVVRLLSLEPLLMERTLKEMAESPYVLARRNAGIVRQKMKSPDQLNGVYGHLMKEIACWSEGWVPQATCRSTFEWSFLREPGAIALGRTSTKLFEIFPELKKRYWGRHFWARGYFCVTSGEVTEEMIKHYLEHHFEPKTDDHFRTE